MPELATEASLCGFGQGPTMGDGDVVQDLAGKSICGGASLLASETDCSVFRLVGTVVLTRLLMPDHFGLISIVVAITSFAEMFEDFGFATVTIQQKEVTQEQVSALFSINAVVRVAFAAVFAPGSPII